jgi:hypothetical protein
MAAARPDNGLNDLDRKREAARRTRTPPPPRHPRPEPQPEATPESTKKKIKKGDRTAFTWRLTVDQSVRQSALINRLCVDLQQGKLDKADVLEALVSLAETNHNIYNALVARLSGR